ncbi:hypothetical protein C8J57DRAFT_1465066 [Mycena rebaudengoi]|nr:hypothetical protein C8J57DRAFT_1465066 [Mycena rebaudengoi]
MGDDVIALSYACTYFSGFLTIWSAILGQFFLPAPTKVRDVFNLNARTHHRSHISHMRIDRFRRLAGYPAYANQGLLGWLWGQISRFLFPSSSATWMHRYPSDSHRHIEGRHDTVHVNHVSNSLLVEHLKTNLPDYDNIKSPPLLEDCGYNVSKPIMSSIQRVLICGNGEKAYRMTQRWNRTSLYQKMIMGQHTHVDLPCAYVEDRDQRVHSASEPESNTPKRKRKSSATVRPRKRQYAPKDSTESNSDLETGIRVTAKSHKRRTGGIVVDEVIHIESAPESWDVPPLSNRVAYILDLNATPGLLKFGNKTLTVDGFVKKECQDSFTGPTGAKGERGLAKVIILDNDTDEPVACRRSTLTCSGCYICKLAADDFLSDCQRWEETDKPHLRVSDPIMTAKTAEAGSVAAVASAFYRGIIETLCKGKFLDSDTICGGRPILRKFSQPIVDGKMYFIGCQKWAHGDSDQMSKSHRFTAIPSAVRESILFKLFKGDPIDEVDDDTDALSPNCKQIIHPSHLPKNSVCSRNHFKNSQHIIAKLKKHQCSAQLSLLIPINKADLRAVIIPSAGAPHSHPSFPRTKIPSAIKQKYVECVDATAGTVGTTTLRVDKSLTTHSLLGGQLSEELHPGMINKRKRRDIVKESRETLFPDGTGLPEFGKDRFRDMQDRYIHAVAACADGTHVIITINPELATLTLDAAWIMVDTTFAVVHGKTNEWKLIVWLNLIDKRTVIGRVWSDSEGAQAQGLADFIILRRMNLPDVGGTATVDINTILKFIWKTCIVHFNRGVFGLKSYVSENDLAYLLGFPYLCSREEINEYYAFCAASTDPKVQNWWAHKISYPWLLPSLNRELSRMDKRHWDLTPRDTNPIEGSHAQDNQVNSTRRLLLEAIFAAKKLDSDTLESSRRQWFQVSWRIPTTLSKHDSRTSRSGSLTGREAKKLRDEVRAGKQQAKNSELEILKLREQIAALKQTTVGQPPQTPRRQSQPVAGPSRLSHQRSISPQNYINVDDDFAAFSEPMRPFRLFPGLCPATPIADPRSDFDYEGALNSDIIDTTLRAIAEDHPMYPVDDDEEVLASDPYFVG